MATSTVRESAPAGGYIEGHIEWRITYADVTDASTTQTLTLTHGLTNAYVYGAYVVPLQYFDDDPTGTISAVTLNLSPDGTDADGLIAAANLFNPTLSTPIAGAGALSSPAGTPVYDASPTIEALFTSTDANLSTLTRGACVIYIHYKRLVDEWSTRA